MDGLCLLRSTSINLLMRLSSASRFISTRVVLEAPYRGTLAHGFLTLSLLPQFQRQVAELRGISRTIHHGVNRLLIHPAIRNGVRIHAVQALFATARVDPDTSCLTSECSIEIDGETKQKGCLSCMESRWRETGAVGCAARRPSGGGSFSEFQSRYGPSMHFVRAVGQTHRPCVGPRSCQPEVTADPRSAV